MACITLVRDAEVDGTQLLHLAGSSAALPGGPGPWPSFRGDDQGTLSREHLAGVLVDLEETVGRGSVGRDKTRIDRRTRGEAGRFVLSNAKTELKKKGRNAISGICQV